MDSLNVLFPGGHLSFTKIDMYRRCGKQFEFRYVKGMKEPPALKPGAGKAGHAGIEAHMRKKMVTGEDPPVELMLDAFATDWRTSTEGVELQPEENIDKTKDAMAYTLQHYHATAAPDITPKAIEQEFLLPMTVDGITLPPVKGYIDIIKVPVNGPPTLDIDDTKFKFPGKTGRMYAKTQADIDWSTQLTLYDDALQAAGIKVDRLSMTSILGPVFKDGEPIPVKDPQVLPVFRDERLMQEPHRSAIIQRNRRVMLDVVNAVANGTFIPTNDPRTCSWCGFRKICPDSLAKDEFLAQMIREENPA